jgi:hypothetical protein
MFVLLCGAVGGASAAGGPMADAGLDQTVTDGKPVELDGSGSFHPDGQITSYEWSIETEKPGTFEPDCPNCERTDFVPPTPGTYNVTLTVTSNTGRSATDSMSLTVTTGSSSVELFEASEIRPYRPVTLVSEYDPSARSDITIAPNRDRRALGVGRETFQPGDRSIAEGGSTTVATSTSVIEAGAGSDTGATSSSEAAEHSRDYTSPAASMLRERSPNATDDS